MCSVFSLASVFFSVPSGQSSTMEAVEMEVTWQVAARDAPVSARFHHALAIVDPNEGDSKVGIITEGNGNKSSEQVKPPSHEHRYACGCQNFQ